MTHIAITLNSDFSNQSWDSLITQPFKAGWRNVSLSLFPETAVTVAKSIIGGYDEEIVAATVPIALSRKIVHAVVGLALLTPIINTIIWLAFTIFHALQGSVEHSYLLLSNAEISNALALKSSLCGFVYGHPQLRPLLFEQGKLKLDKAGIKALLKHEITPSSIHETPSLLKSAQQLFMSHPDLLEATDQYEIKVGANATPVKLKGLFFHAQCTSPRLNIPHDISLDAAKEFVNFIEEGIINISKPESLQDLLHLAKAYKFAPIKGSGRYICEFNPNEIDLSQLADLIKLLGIDFLSFSENPSADKHRTFMQWLAQNDSIEAISLNNHLWIARQLYLESY